MSLSDIVSGAGSTLYVEIALVIFFLVFVGIVVYVALRRKGTWEHERNLPLDDGEPVDEPEDKDR